MKKLLIFIGLIIVPLIGFSQNMLIYNGEPGETVDQAARDSTVANAEDIAANTTAIEDTSVYTDYIYTKAEVDSLISYALTHYYPDSATWHDTYKTIFAAFPTKPSGYTATVHNTFIQDMSDSSYLERIDVMAVLGGEYADNGGFDWMHVDSTFTLVNSPTWNSDGYLADSANGRYIDTDRYLYTETDNSSQDDRTIIVYVTNNVACANPPAGANDGTDHLYINPRYTDDLAYIRMNSTASTSSDMGGNSRGYWAASRTESANQYGYYNGDEGSFTGAVASSGVIGYDLIIGGRATSTTMLSNYRTALVILMDGTTASEQVGIYGMVQTLATGLGFAQ